MTTIADDVLDCTRTIINKLNQSPLSPSHLDLSDAAKQIALLKDMIFNEPEINHPHVQVIREEIAAGHYYIHSHKIAEKMLEQFHSI